MDQYQTAPDLGTQCLSMRLQIFQWMDDKNILLFVIIRFKLFVAFPWVETSTGPGGFMICVFII